MGPLQSEELLKLSKETSGGWWFPQLALISVPTLTTGKIHTARFPWVSDPDNG